MTRPASFWIRVVAALVDFGVFTLVDLSLRVIAVRVFRTDLDDVLGVRGAVGACTLLFAALYVIALHALEGQTLGKLLVGIRVVGSDGAPPAIGASVLRFFGYFVSLVPFGLGFVMAGLRADHRALHDLLADTRVERLARPTPRPPAPEPEELIAP